MKFTGERALLNDKSLLFLLHLERYKFASKYAKNTETLDISCGTGYGTELLSKVAKSVIGIDIDPETINNCCRRDVEKKITFIVGDGSIYYPPFNNKFNLIVSFETIEHIKDYNNFLDNLRRYLKKEGKLIISTPNNYKKIHPPANKFHIYEFDIEQLVDLVKKKFPDRKILVFGQGATKDIRGEVLNSQSNRVKFINKVVDNLYCFDLKYVGIINLLQGSDLYKKIGNFYRGWELKEKIYKINLKEKYYNPSISLLVIK